MSGAEPAVYRPDLSLRGKLRRRIVRLQHRRPALSAPGGPWVTFSFDDAPRSAFSEGLPILEAHGVRATLFACGGLVGATTVLGPMMGADELRAAHARGHEVAGHTFSHRDLGQATVAQTEAELDADLGAFRELGLPPPATFAYPYGDVCAAAKAVCGARFALSRALHPGRVTKGSDLAQAPATSTDGPGGEAAAMTALRETAARGGWLILFGHRVDRSGGEFATDPDALSRLAAAAIQLGLEPVTAAAGVRRLGA